MEGHKDSGEDHFAGAVDAICRNIVDMLGTNRIHLVTPYRHNGIGNFYGGKNFEDSNRHDTDQKNFHGHCLEEYVDILVQAAGDYNIPVLNLHEQQGFDWKIHTLDGCHPNEEGHKWLAGQIGQSITAGCRLV